MKSFIMILILFCSILLANESLRKAKEMDQANFIDQIQSEDPDLQMMINRLKKDFQNQKEQVNNKYQIKKETLKKQKQQEMDQIRGAFRKKIKKLKNRYPEQIHSNKAKHVNPERKHVKPFDKKKNKYEDPRFSKTNYKENSGKSSKKLCGSDCVKSCCVDLSPKKDKKLPKKNK